jgi:hypothetical protein
MQIYATNDGHSKYVNILLYGMSGAGKTPIAATAPAPLIVASEPGLKSLSAYKLPYVLGRTQKEAMDVLKWIQSSSEARQFETIFFDSISMLSENILMDAKKSSNDPRKYSPATTGATMEVVLAYLNITNKHVVMTCKAVLEKDGVSGATSYAPFAVVPKLGPALPYHFDEVLYLSRHRDPTSGQEFAALRCRWDAECPQARDRSGNLDLWEKPDLTAIINKINYGVK